MAVLKNRAKMSTSTVGTGTITLGSAEPGYQTFAAAGVSNGDSVRYTIEDGTNWEVGVGTYTSSGTTLSRTPSESSSGGSAINLSGDATVFITAAAADIMQPSNNLSDLANASTARTNLGVAIGSDVQAYDADLTALGGLAKTDGNFIVGNGTTWVAESGATARTSLGLGTAATSAATDFVAVTGDTMSGALSISAASAAPAVLNRTTTEGDIVDFQYAGSTAGKIGISGGYYIMGDGASGLLYDPGTPSIMPFNYSGNQLANGTISLGTGSAKWNVFYVNDVHTGALNINGAIEFPTADGTSGQVLQTNGSGTLSFGTIDTSSLMPLAGGTFTGDVTFDGATAGRDIVFDRSDNALEFADNARAIFGTGGDLEIYHTGGESLIDNIRNDLTIRQLYNDGDVAIRSDDGSGNLADYFRADGSTGEVQLYYYGSQKLATKTGGVEVTGTVTATAFSGDGSSLTGISSDLVNDTSPQLGGALQLNGHNIQANDSTGVTQNRIQLGTSQDLQLYHDGSNSYITNSTGTLTIENSSTARDVFLKSDNGSGGTNTYIGLEGGDTYLYGNYGTSLKFKTGSTGNTNYGTFYASGKITANQGIDFQGNSNLDMGDSTNSLNNRIKFGTSDDLQIYHDGSNSYIVENGTGNLYLQGDNLFLRNSAGTENHISAISNGQVTLFYDNSSKLDTTSTGINVTGNITVSGTVDGRDVATDGTKLDGIEAGADVTDATNVAAAGAAMTTGATFTGDVTFAGANSNLVFDTSANILTFNDFMEFEFKDSTYGTTARMFDSNGGLNIQQESTAASSDMQISNQDGSSNLVIRQYSSGNIRTAIRATNSGDVELHYQGGAKLATTSSGVNVTGNITVSGTVDGVDIATNIPSSLGTAGQVLTVNAGATAGEWADAGGGGGTEFSSSGLKNLISTGGTDAGADLTTGGDYNIFLGQQAGTNTTTADFNIALGFEALHGSDSTAQTGGSNIALGYQAGYSTTTGSNNVILGTGAGDAITTGADNVAIGRNSSGAMTTASNNVTIGNGAGQNITTGTYNFFSGNAAGGNITTGGFNTGIGYEAGKGGSSSGAQHTVAIGFQSLLNVTGSNNIALGAYSGFDVTSGEGNIFIGDEAGNNTTTASYNIAIGYEALHGNDSTAQTGAGNIGIGYRSLYASTSGANNTAVGYQSLRYVTTGYNNNAFGYHALLNTTTGFNNSAFGRSTLEQNTTGGNNTSVGHYSLNLNNTGGNNTAVGYEALKFNTTDNNTAVGYQAGYSVTTGSNNVFIGYQAGLDTTTAVGTVGIGYNALTNQTTGTNNTAIGYNSLTTLSTGTRNTAVGWNSGYSVSTGGNSVSFGYESLFNQTTAFNNTAIGYQALYSTVSGGSNVAVGQGAARNGTGSNNTAIGKEALFGVSGSTTGNDNIAIGYAAMVAATTAYSNVVIGKQAGDAMTTGFTNVIIGNSAGGALTTSFNNIAIGHETLQYATTGYRNTAVGYQALRNNTTQNENTAFGWQAAVATTTGTVTAVGALALHDNTTGGLNTAVGYTALGVNTTGTWNTAMGYSALSGNTTGTKNTTLGFRAGDNITTGANNTVIGAEADASSATASNEITLGSTAVTRFRVPGAGIDNTSAALSGTTPSVDVGARDTYTLTTSGNTTFTFTNPPASPQVGKFTLILTAGGTHTLTWPASVDWAGGTAPDAPASGEKNIYTFMTIDGGTTYYGFLAGAAFA